MALVTRGRLSVQRVEEDTWGVIELLADKGGWDEGAGMKPKQRKPKTQVKVDPHNGESARAATAGAVAESAKHEKSPPRRSTRDRTVRS